MDPRQPTHSAFSRFSDRFKESTRRKSTISPTLVSTHINSTNSRDNHEATAASSIRRLSRDERRGSASGFTDKMRQMLSPTARVTRGINDLPVEVLHHMLLYLDFWDLLKCQRVCRLWRDLIPGDSPLLAEVLYLKPSRTLQIYSSVPATFDFDFDVAEIPVETGGVDLDPGPYQKKLTMTRRCTALIRTSSEIVFHPIIVNFDHYMQSGVFRGMSEESEGCRPKDERGSWESMLVSMPPLQELRVRYGRTRQVYRLLSVRNGDEGIRLGDLFQAMDEWDDFSAGSKEKLLQKKNAPSSRKKRWLEWEGLS